MEQLARKPDELWTSYLIRRLEAEGINVGRFSESDRNFQTELDIDLKNGSIVDIVRCVYPDLLGDMLCDGGLCYSDFTRVVLEDLVEKVVLGTDSNPKLVLSFCSDGTVRPDNDALAETESEPILLKYSNSEGQWRAEDVIDDVVNYIKTVGIVDAPRVPEKVEVPTPEPEVPLPSQSPRNTPDAGKLEEILRTVKRLERIAGEHPLVLQDDAHYLQQLYTNKINEDPGNLKFFEYDGQRIAYVLVHSSDLEGIPGRASVNLYFVARDKAPEEWQQRIIAFHESLCIKLGHEKAREKEVLLAEHLGKKDEYLIWRKEIDENHSVLL